MFYIYEIVGQVGAGYITVGTLDLKFKKKNFN